jgi:hypothetical protein
VLVVAPTGEPPFSAFVTANAGGERHGAGAVDLRSIIPAQKGQL